MTVSRQINIQSTHTSQHPTHLVQYTDQSLWQPMHRDLILPRTGLHWRLLQNLRRHSVRYHCGASDNSRITSEEKIKGDDYYQEGGKAIAVVCQIIAHGGYDLLVTRWWSEGSCLVLFDVIITTFMYHLLKGLHGYLTRSLLFRDLLWGS